MMAKLQSLKTNAKDRLEENDQQIEALKTTNDQLKEMLDSSEKEQEKLNSEMKALELSKQVNIRLERNSQMSRIMTKITKWHVSPAKIQISLGILLV